VVVDPDRDTRRGRVLRTVGIAGTVAGAGLLIGGLIGIFSLVSGGNPFTFFWMPFAGGFLLVIAVWVWAAGNLLSRSARFARETAAGSGWDCRACGSRNPAAAGACSACGTARA
jgi:hypothetical protein